LFGWQSYVSKHHAEGAMYSEFVSSMRKEHNFGYEFLGGEEVSLSPLLFSQLGKTKNKKVSSFF
jgi:hypothetical protein